MSQFHNKELEEAFLKLKHRKTIDRIINRILEIKRMESEERCFYMDEALDLIKELESATKTSFALIYIQGVKR